ncbi:MAG: cell division protein SepF [Acidimicrobiia bacterium]
MATEPQLVRCKAFIDCQEVGDRFKANQVVDMLLTRTSEQDARRLTDFASGLVYAAGGTMEKIGPEQFRLTPPPPPAGTSGDREPRSPKPAAGTDGAVVPAAARRAAECL